MTEGRPRPIVLARHRRLRHRAATRRSTPSRPRRMPRWRGLLATWPHSPLDASGPAVGLPAGQMGNSEVGHLNLGAGRPVLQDLPRIDAAIADGSFFRERGAARRRPRAAVGRGRGCTSSASRPRRRARQRPPRSWPSRELAHARASSDVVVHALLDGRDTPPRSADGFLADFEARLAVAHPAARIATIGGRYYGMDRDQRWERVEALLRAMVDGRGRRPRRPPSDGPRGGVRARRERRVRPAHGRRRRRRHGARRRRGHPLQLPGRPRPAS